LYLTANFSHDIDFFVLLISEKAVTLYEQKLWGAKQTERMTDLGGILGGILGGFWLPERISEPIGSTKLKRFSISAQKAR